MNQKMNLKRKLEKYLLRKLLKAVDEKDLLSNLDDNQTRDLQIQAKDYIQKDSLFNMLLTDADDVAKGKMWRHGETTEDIRFGRVMLYCTDVLRKKARLLSDKLPTQAQRVGRE